MRLRLFCCLLACAGATAHGQDTTNPVQLKAPADFNGIADRNARSVALFQEASKVITSPRCLNCHPNSRIPTQGNDLHTHNPPMNATATNIGNPGLLCLSCHQSKNVLAAGTTFRSIPGHEKWSLAPQSMAWQGKSLGEICVQLKDMSRNGGKDLKALHEHMATDTLVGWGWHPGPGRVPAPGTQQQFGQLIQAWIDTGAQCPG